MTLVERKETEYGFDDTRRDKQLVKRCNSLFVQDDKVSRTRGTLYTGVNRYSLKRWWKWEYDGGYGMRLTKNGLVMPYALKGRGKAASPLIMLHNLDSGNDGYQDDFSSFRQAVKDTFGVEKTSDIYTTLKFYENGVVPMGRNEFHQELLPHMRHTNYREFIESAYGKKMFRKDLVKSAANSTISAIEFTRPFRYLPHKDVPTDWVVDFLRRNTDFHLSEIGDGKFIESWASLLSHLNTTSKRNILRHSYTYQDIREWRDIMRMFTNRFGRVVPRQDMNFRNIGHLHDQMVYDGRQARGQVAFQPLRGYTPPVEKDKDVALTPMAEKLHGKMVEGMTVKMVENTAEMTEWSDTMGNCIRSYKSQAVQGTGEYGALYKGDKLIANFEIRNDKLEQLLGKFNHHLDAEKIPVLEQFFFNNGVDISQYWGKPAKADVENTLVGAGWQDLGYIDET